MSLHYYTITILTLLSTAGCVNALADNEEWTISSSAVLEKTSLQKVGFYGPVNSVAYRVMARNFTLTTRAKADVLVVDGDSISPTKLKTDSIINSHLAKGKVLFLTDLSLAHKTHALTTLTLGARLQSSYATLVRRVLDRYGHPYISVLEFPKKSGLRPKDGEIKAFVSASKFFLSSPGLPEDDDFDPPPGLIYVRFNFAEPTQSYQFTSHQNGRLHDRPPQNTSVIRNLAYTLFLENGQNATGDRQWLVAHSDILTSPINEDLGTKSIMIEKPGSVFESREMGWFQAAIDESIIPSEFSDLVQQSTSPQNTNKQSQVRSSASFGISFNPFGNSSGSFSYSTQDVNNVTQWDVFDNSSGNAGTWSWQNQDPWQYNNSGIWESKDYGGGYEGVSGFRKPNNLAQGQMTVDTKTVYSTNSVLTSTETIAHNTIIHYLDVWALAFHDISSQVVSYPLQSSYGINMAAVVPIPIKAITFSQNPVNAATTSSVTGTVELESPAVSDTVINMAASSVNENASVLPTVTIKQGSRSATFQVLVNNNLIPSGGKTVATIEGFYAEANQVELTINNN